MKLGEALLSLLCPLNRPQHCECEVPQPVRTGCGYGECEIIRCRACGRVISFFRDRCRYPRST